MKITKGAYFITISFFLFISMQVFAQQISYSDLADPKSEKKKGPFAVYTSYVSQNGAIYNVGDTLKVGTPSGTNGKFIYIEDSEIDPKYKKPVGTELTNTNVIIKSMSVVSDLLNKAKGYKIKIHTRGGFLAKKYEFLLEDAIQAGEIKSFGKTSDEALAELKKAKDKLDLGLITQAEFDALREDLKKYIK